MSKSRKNKPLVGIPLVSVRTEEEALEIYRKMAGIRAFTRRTSSTTDSAAAEPEGNTPTPSE